MALNNAELSVVLEEINDKQVADTVNRSAVLRNLLGKADDINGRGVNVFAKVSDNYALKWFGEGGVYPVGGNSSRVKMTANYARLAVSSQVTRDVLEGADNKAIINVISEEIMDDTLSAVKELSQQLYGNGSGVKAIVASSDGSGNVTFRSGASDVTPDNANYGNAYGTYLIKKNARYNFISGDGSVDRDAGTGGTQTVAVGTKLQGTAGATVFTPTGITSGTVAAFGAEPVAGYTLADGDMLVYEDSYGISVNGLDYHIDSGTGTYQNVSRNTYNSLRCYTLNASNAALSVAFLYKLVNQAKYLRNQDILDEDYVIISSPAMAHQYQLLADLSASGVGGKTTLDVMPNGGKLDYGFRYLSFNGLKWIEDSAAPPTTLYIILPSKFKIHEFKPLSPVLGGDGGFAPVPAFTSAGSGSYTDNAVYTMTWKGQLVTNDPAKAGLKIYNLATAGLALPTNGFSLS